MRRLLPPAFYLGLAVLLTWPAAAHPVGDVPGAERTDLWDSLWSFWYFWVRVRAGEWPLRVDGLLDFPDGGILWVADPVNAVLALPLIPLAGVAAAWTTLVIAHITFAGLAAHALGQAVSPDRPWAGWVSGVLYASAPILLAHVHNGASEAVGTGWMALAALRLLRCEEQPGARNVVAAGVALALTAVAHWYAGVALFLWALLIVLRSRKAAVLYAVLLGIALVSPVAWFARDAATAEENVVGIKSESEIATVRRTIGPADPEGFLRPGDYRSPDFRELSRYGEEYIHCHYLGWVGLLAAVASIRKRRGTLAWWVGGLLAAVLACGPVLAQKGGPVILPGNLAVPLPYFLLERLPGFSSLSLLWRLSQLTALAVAVLAGRAAGGRRLLAAIVASGALAEALWLSPMSGQRETTNAVISPAIVALASAPDGALMNFPVAGGRAFLYEQTAHGKPLTGGLKFSKQQRLQARVERGVEPPQRYTRSAPRSRGEEGTSARREVSRGACGSDGAPRHARHRRPGPAGCIRTHCAGRWNSGLSALVDDSCEGLGQIGARTFLNGTVGEWRGASARLRSSAPGLVWSAAAVTALSRLPAGARGYPAMTMLAPILALNGASAWISEGDGCGELLPFDAMERCLPGIQLPSGPVHVADAWVLPVGHWNQLLWANLLALGPFLWGALVGTGVWPAFRIGWAAARAWSTRPEDLAARLNHREAGSAIHRNATVEGCYLGAGARVGAGAVVRGAILGEGAVVEELALVEGTVLGRGARVQRMAMAKYAVIEEAASFAGIMQLGVVGRGAVVKHGATLMDMAFGQVVRVLVAERLVEAPHGLCGVCVGENAVVASGVRIAPGRLVPAGLEVLADPASVLTRLDLPAGCRRAYARNGVLEPT